MKKIVFILVALFVGFNLSAQEQIDIGIDGMYLGKYWQSIYSIISRDNPSYKIQHNNEQRYFKAVSGYSVDKYYEVYYGIDEKVVKIKKRSFIYGSYAEQYLADIIVEMNHVLGKPDYMGDNSCIWRTDKYKVSIYVGEIPPPVPEVDTRYNITEIYEKLK